MKFTVEYLIERLSEYPKDMPVIIEYDEKGVITHNDIQTVTRDDDLGAVVIEASLLFESLKGG